jgi:hypothetical protein
MREEPPAMHAIPDAAALSQRGFGRTGLLVTPLGRHCQLGPSRTAVVGCAILGA